ncbi:MAG TPA: lipoate--protein ligase family protein [Pirellulales bacterium]|jgi:lipoate-protein ligase A
MLDVRLINSPAKPGDWNMAVDAALMESAERSGRATLRFYRWDEPTLSLGYFQTYASRAGHAASNASPLVRRSTGGGAIVHDCELTYSLTAPVTHPLAADAEAMYRLLHGALVDALAEWRVTASLCQQGSGCRPSEEPFLCFQRRSVGDVLLGGEKIAGSAQRRKRGAVLQHGSVLLQKSAAAPELMGLVDLTGRALSDHDLAAAWRQTLTARRKIQWQAEVLIPVEVERAAQLVDEIYGQTAWNLRR